MVGVEVVVPGSVQASSQGHIVDQDARVVGCAYAVMWTMWLVAVAVNWWFRPRHPAHCRGRGDPGGVADAVNAGRWW